MSQSSSHSQARGVDASVWSPFDEVRCVLREDVREFFRSFVKTAQCCSNNICGCFHLLQTLHLAHHKSHVTSGESIHPSSCLSIHPSAPPVRGVEMNAWDGVQPHVSCLSRVKHRLIASIKLPRRFIIIYCSRRLHWSVLIRFIPGRPLVHSAPTLHLNYP